MNQQNIQSKRETLYFVIALIFSLLIYVFTAISIIGIAVLLFALLVLLLLQAIQLGSIRGNGMRISQQQFPDVYQRAEQLASDIGLKKTPDFFVIQSEGALNAFATRFFGRNMIVVYSEVFDLARQQGDKELDFIIAHELAHIKRNHVWKNIFIFPAQFIPFLAQAYSRSCEYTCDRHAASLIQDGMAAKSALTMLGVGKVMYKEVNEDAYLEQIHSESNGAVWLSEVLSTHPLLPKRIMSVERFVNPETPYAYKPRNGRIALTGIALATGFIASIVAVVLAIPFAISFFANNFEVAGEDLFASDELIADESMEENDIYLNDDDVFYEDNEDMAVDLDTTELMDAVTMGDIATATTLVAEGADLEATDAEGTTALLYATYGINTEMVEALLELGADPNVEDDYTTPLINAVNFDEPEMASVLIEYGADPELETSYGLSPVDQAEFVLEQDFYEWLNQ